jgi:PPOX class probable F420-dependent enzyme
MDVTEMQRRVSTARVARLATVTRAGAPHLVPVCFALSDHDIVSVVDDKPKTTTALRRLDNVRANPAVSLLVDEYEEDWRRLWWVRVDGHARVVEGGAAYDQSIAALAAKYEQYRADPPSGLVLAITPETWRGWSWSG